MTRALRLLSRIDPWWIVTGALLGIVFGTMLGVA